MKKENLEQPLETGFLEADSIRQVLDGNEDAFTDIVDHYQNHVFNLCYRMLGTPQEAEDAAQESFIRAYNTSVVMTKVALLPPGCYPLPHIIALSQRKRRLIAIDLDEIMEIGITDDAPDLKVR
jgi:RNA polymerase sigma-70 factor (ECF subfamily)